MADRSAFPAYPGRHHRQYSPRRNLHRQALFARWRDRPTRAGRIPCARDAAGPAHVARAAIADPGADRKTMARTAAGQIRALGDDAARPLHAAAFPLGRLFGRAHGAKTVRLRFFAGLVRRAARIPVSRVRPCSPWWRRAGSAAGAGALARSRRRGLGRRHRALCRFVGGAVAGQGQRLHRRPPRGHLQRPADADDGNRPLGGSGRRRPLQGLATGLRAASDHTGSRAVDV